MVFTSRLCDGVVEPGVLVTFGNKTQTQFPDCAPIRAKFVRENTVSGELRSSLFEVFSCWCLGAIRRLTCTDTISLPATRPPTSHHNPRQRPHPSLPSRS